MEKDTKLNIQKYLVKSGLVLEIQAQRLIEEICPDIAVSITENRVGYKNYQHIQEVSEGSRETIHEIDLLTISSKAYEGGKLYSTVESKQFGRSIPEILPTTLPTNQTITTYIIAECKGNPSDGFLLCKKNTNLKEDFKIPLIMGSSQHDFIDPFLPAKSNLFCDAVSFKIKSNNNRIYKENDNFYKAQMQIIEGVTLINQSINKELNMKTQRFSESIRNILPIIITNADIYCLDNNAGSISLTKIPWFIQNNTFKITGQNAASQKFFEKIFVVNIQELQSFLKRFFSLEPNLSVKSPKLLFDTSINELKIC